MTENLVHPQPNADLLQKNTFTQPNLTYVLLNINTQDSVKGVGGRQLTLR